MNLVIVGELCRLLLHVVGLFIRQSANVIICLDLLIMKRLTQTDSTDQPRHPPHCEG